MKVAYVSHCNFPNRFAHSIQIIKNAQAWNGVVDDFTLFANIYPKSFLQFDKERLNEFYGIKQDFNIEKYPYYWEIEHWLITRYWKPFSNFSKELYFKKVAKKVKHQNYDLAYTRTIGFPKQCIKQGIPVILESHSPLGSDLDKEEVHQYINHDLFLKIITISEQLKQRMIANGLPKDKILVAPDGVDLHAYSDNLSKEQAREKLGYTKEGKYALYVGHLYKDRGIKEIMYSASHMPDTKFIIVGGHENDIEYWQQYVLENNLNNVDIVGFVENKYVPLYQWMADVLLMPYSKTCGTAEWMSPLKLFEYMASGRAIIASHFPVFDGILEHKKNCYLTEADNQQSLYDGLKFVFDNTQLMKSISNKAKSDIKKHSWEARVKFILSNI